jgi:hypothetical protein
LCNTSPWWCRGGDEIGAEGFTAHTRTHTHDATIRRISHAVEEKEEEEVIHELAFGS